MEVTVTRAGASCSVSITQVGQFPERTKPCVFVLEEVCFVCVCVIWVRFSDFG